MPIKETGRTPYYTLDLRKVKENYTNFRNALTRYNRHDIIAYSIKANYHPSIIKLLNDLGSWFEICSKYEYDILMKYAVSPQRIIANGCSAASDVLQWASKCLVILDAFEQLEAWISEGCTKQIGLRVNLNTLTKDARFRNKTSRFGIDLDSLDAQNLLSKADLSKICCLHCHLSGNSRDPSIYCDVLNQLLKIIEIKTFSGVKYVDIGGGYKIGNDYWTIDSYVEKLHETCNKFKKQDISLIYEPGSFLVRNACEYHTRIIAIKNLNNCNIAIADGSSLHLPKADFKRNGFRVIHSNSARIKEVEIEKLYGNTCKESDVIFELKGEGVYGVGDTIILQNLGAYSINEVNALILGFPKIRVIG